jgi:hypothetical protein
MALAPFNIPAGDSITRLELHGSSPVAWPL